MLNYFRVDGADQFSLDQRGVKRSSVKISKIALRPSSIEVYIQDNENGPLQLQASLQALQNKTTHETVRAVGALTKGWRKFDAQVIPKPRLISPVTACSVVTKAEPLPVN